MHFQLPQLIDQPNGKIKSKGLMEKKKIYMYYCHSAGSDTKLTLIFYFSPVYRSYNCCRNKYCCPFGTTIVAPILLSVVATLMVGIATLTTCQFFVLGVSEFETHVGPWLVEDWLDEDGLDDGLSSSSTSTAADVDFYHCVPWSDSYDDLDDLFDTPWTYGRIGSLLSVGLGLLLITLLIATSCTSCTNSFKWAPYVLFSILTGLPVSLMAMVASENICMDGDGAQLCKLDWGAYLTIGSSCVFLLGFISTFFMDAIYETRSKSTVPMPSADQMRDGMNTYINQPAMLLERDTHHGSCGCSTCCITICIIMFMILGAALLTFGLVYWSLSVFFLPACAVAFIISWIFCCTLCCVNQ
jgi:hypothetical protein